MSGRRLRRLVLLALVVAAAYWIYRARPTATGVIDSLTNPLMGSKAAVESSERNRVVGEATVAMTEQTDAAVGTLREGMTTSEVRELVGQPEKIEDEKADGEVLVRWTYARLHRVLVFRDGRVTSIAIK